MEYNYQYNYGYISNEQQQRLDEYNKYKLKLITRGKVIIIIIAILNIMSSAFSSLLINLNIVKFLVQLIFTIALYRGVTWIRYLFAIGGGLAFAFSVFLLCGGLDLSSINIFLELGINIKIVLVVAMCYSLITCVLLFSSKSVKEFMLSQKDKRSKL